MSRGADTKVRRAQPTEEADALPETRFRDLFEAAPDAILVVDEGQNIAMANTLAGSMFGYEASHLIGKPLHQIIPERFHPDHTNHVEKFIASSEQRRLMSTRPELRARRKEGSEFPVEMTLAKLTPNERRLITVIVRDTTHRHSVEQALRSRQDELERLVQSKDQLISAISHEIRTPLAAVVGFAQLLRDEEAGLTAEDRAEMTSILIRQSGDLTNLVDDLLVAAKANTGKLEVTIVSVDLRAQAAQALEGWLADMEFDPIALPSETVRCLGDPARVRQIVRNLVSNAIKYGRPEITVSISSDDRFGRLAVMDNGAGVPEERRETIFDAYEHGAPSGSVVPSLGLGLYISRELARRMGGDLTYRYDGRSVFELSLPRTPE
jgi:PAS domain S-box-containing protein